MSEWLPIEAAPKGEGKLLLAAPYYKQAFIGYYNYPANSWLNSKHHEKEQPTHWMPIPKLPKKGE
ncbi:hypothetical protein UFOVP275_49 [uncultured Caudovirales phage]|uniref:DUF551 domain-containing protein n=1 Tax=uncultured Caudovirales phage TaxID=2100421 RepID=A0A6J5LTI2_9CAUD|nr:hypothetical protein UFOVP275_49 [uncultured Caudovirales phage]